MAIDASVAYVELKENGGGTLHLVDRGGSDRNIAGQPRLHFDAAPYEVTALNGLDVWGSTAHLMLGEMQIADRTSYTRIRFRSDETFKEAVRRYHEKRRATREDQAE